MPPFNNHMDRGMHARIMAKMAARYGHRGKSKREKAFEQANREKERIEQIATTTNEPKILEGTYRQTKLHVPTVIDECGGIVILGRRIKSLVFSTDLAIICNCDADAVFAVYPYTCQPTITQALVNASSRPVIAGVAGGTTHGMRSMAVAIFAEMQGVSAVVVNAPHTSRGHRCSVRNHRRASRAYRARLRTRNLAENRSWRSHRERRRRTRHA